MSIYKSGQGYYTRLLSAVGATVLVVAGAAWLWNQLEVLQNENRLYIQAGVAVGMLVPFGLFIYWLTCRHQRAVDFMIATELEMKKVNWPGRREIIGSTWIVIAGTLMFAALLFVVDIAFAAFFQWIHILET